MQDRLERMMKIQAEFANKVVHSRDIESLTKDYVLHISHEAHEVLDKVNWKQHRGEKHEVVRENVVEEIVDVIKLAMGLAHHWGVTDQMLYDEFIRKSAVVEQRYRQEHLDLKDNRKVAAIDIDGVLANYDESWIEYLSVNCHQTFDTVDQAKTVLGVKKYEHLKDQYRRTDALLRINKVPGASEFTKELRKSGFTIVLLSARPYRKYLRIYADTQLWLRANDIWYDCLYFDDQKHLRIVEHVPHLSFMVEDDLAIANTVGNMGYTVYLRRNSQEKATTNPYRIISYHDFSEVLNWIR